MYFQGTLPCGRAAKNRNIRYVTRQNSHEFVTESAIPAEQILKALEDKGILGGYPLDEHHILWCCTEVNTKEEMDQVIRILKEVPAC